MFARGYNYHLQSSSFSPQSPAAHAFASVQTVGCLSDFLMLRGHHESGGPDESCSRNLVLTQSPSCRCLSVFSLSQDAKHDFALKLFTFFDHLERSLRDKLFVILNLPRPWLLLPVFSPPLLQALNSF